MTDNIIKYAAPTAYQRARGRLSHKRQSIYQHSPFLIQDIVNILPDPMTKTQNLHLDIGFGQGDELIQKCKNNPHELFLGIDLYRAGIAKVLEHIQHAAMTNLYLWEIDAAQAFKQCQDHSIDSIHIFHPDPWPKKRQHKRRLITQSFLLTALSKCRPSGTIQILSDHPGYTDTIINITNSLQDQARITVEANVKAITKYGHKAIAEGRSITRISLSPTIMTSHN
ncbi:MAG: hypothetical protein VXY77_04965 [Pseudomonadota bacterium]|nr:hypothetical protein [Pseudomonadota bacterium]